MSRLILGLVVVVVCLSSTLAVAGEPVNRDGQWGMFAGTNGLGLRYWTSDRLALQFSADYYWSKESIFSDQNSAGVSAGVVPALAVHGNMRLEGLARLSYSRDHYEDDDRNYGQTADLYVISAGLGIEYYFDELPRLTFATTLVGLSFQYTEQENYNGSVETKSYPKYFRTFSDLSAAVTYYF